MHDNKRVIRFQTRIFAVRSADIITNHLIALKLKRIGPANLVQNRNV
jgi:hypothetical protein